MRFVSRFWVLLKNPKRAQTFRVIKRTKNTRSAINLRYRVRMNCYFVIEYRHSHQFPLTF